MPTINRPIYKKNTTTWKPRVKRVRKNRTITESKRMSQEVYQHSHYRKLRLLKLQEQPLCEVCLSKGITRLATQVHHKIPFMQFEDHDERILKGVFCDLTDLMSLCDECHRKMHDK